MKFQFVFMTKLIIYYREIKDSDDDEKLKKKFIEVHGDKFRKFEHKISKKNRLIIK